MENYKKKGGTLWSIGKISFFLFTCIFSIQSAGAQQDQQWITYEPDNGTGNGKHIVLVSGDEEYRSEEALPLLANILARYHGFKTTVLFAINPETGKIDPEYLENIPGLEHLQQADLMVIFTRFRELPDEQMKFIDEYLAAGKPIIGMRTATHAFNYKLNKDSPYSKYSFNSGVAEWEGGFGRKILGETWIAHHGDHGKEGTRGLINGTMKGANHPMLQGVSDIWTYSDVYTTRELKEGTEVLVWGAPTNGMTPNATLNLKKSILPVAWTTEYTGKNGTVGRVFTTTMGASIDLKNEDLRRLLVNACYWALKMEALIPVESNVSIIGEYNPTMFGYGAFRKNLVPSDFQ
jgi:type 1 glutamine amidotransferase